MGLEEQIIKIVEKYFELADRNDCFVVELVMKTKKLEIYIDSDDAIDFGICRKVSRVVEEFLDEGKQMGEDYTLEVSSPGLSRPLRLPRQFKKNVGRDITVTLPDSTKMTGKLENATDNEFFLAYTKVWKEGKKKKTEDVIMPLKYSETNKVMINIKF
ncbi:MAG: hypothetical protein IPO45_13740 [Saprospiraceae bacterium]|jgi:ribosome maturation factor RimP|uniref:ribosome maturation factor RimP n=1 Tax=Candidatus Brachybacter algidus TaxID=2982024 RepID=UPI001B5BCA01|nr:hypothetical protein [Candidatus Brachybacter algidus]MBP7306029.1 hypothetical protein [Saprospiraceae bacterium]MBK6371723.1 hypothetical protein [Candidatus Brachybacter algidus]MBK6448938.1 hypothetical protein [Candidatus Brachybacter algidus]MBK7603848.1 hypothetical protein [Candidatus Brachybacter algidus]MBK8746407.1 hypothetical protein [Candidatus Brachybacter algidus]